MPDVQAVSAGRAGETSTTASSGLTGPSRLQNLESIFGAPLPQRTFDSVGFKRIPVLECTFARQQILEARVSPLPLEKCFGLVVTCRQLVCDKAQGETSSKIE